MKLPGFLLSSDSSDDKLSFYERAKADSAKQQRLRRADPFFKNQVDTAAFSGDNSGAFFSSHQSAFSNGPDGSAGPAASADHISQRLAQLQAELNKPATKPLKETTSVADEAMRNSSANIRSRG